MCAKRGSFCAMRVLISQLRFNRRTSAPNSWGLGTNLDEALKLKPKIFRFTCWKFTKERRSPNKFARIVSPSWRRFSRPNVWINDPKNLRARLWAYEISNFALPGYESKHNTKYWRCEPVYAFGVSAHSFDGLFRRANERDTAKYVNLIETEKSAEVFCEETDVASEFIFLGLRLSNGINLTEYENRFGVNLPEKYAEDLQRLEELELIVFAENHLRLTHTGMIYSNEVFAVFV